MISEPESREAPDDAKLASLTMRLADRLNALGWTLATAESCTGGWIAKCCTDLAGSSVWFRAGIVAYSYKAKQDLLFVDALTIEQEGAVSEAVVNKMAEAVRLSAGADVSVAVSGIAGPGGGTPDKPVGTVCFAWAGPEALQDDERQHFSGDREAVRRHTVAHALEGILKRLPEA